MPFQYNYHIDYRDTTTGIKNTWASKTQCKLAAMNDFKESFGKKYEILKAYIPTSEQIMRGASLFTNNCSNKPPRINYTHYCLVCLDDTTHYFLDHEHPLNDMLGDGAEPLFTRRQCTKCGNILELLLNND